MFVCDTNILIHAAQRHSRFHRECNDLLESWRAQELQWFVTWGISFEFLRVMTHQAVYRSPVSVREAWSFLEDLFAGGTSVLIPGPNHATVLSEVFQELPNLSGGIMHDVHTAALMREHGITQVYSRDTDFHRFPFLEVIDPLKP